MAKALKEEIESIDRLAPGIFKMTLKSKYVAENALPGQFVNIKCSEGINALLRRPVSICDIDQSRGTFDIVFQVKGLGTEYLSRSRPGDLLDIIAPLGTSFDLSPEYKRIAVVGGGIGIFPLLYLLKSVKHAEKTAFLGFRSKEHIVLEDEFKSAADRLLISTDDGSLGHKGVITGLLDGELSGQPVDIIYTCGPLPMLKETIREADKYRVKCQVSLEQRMGCGIGACLVCACKTKHGDEWQYSHVCKDGPVFWSSDVILD
ncbi:dihydroorotate oxidase B electron transfer subunit [Anaerobacterium chartisolvens]|uniref:Dihydroorotate dehydrogenase B (NAD(+)), electron transfer subunit n=1 Tax=Anaerobacterium chartisolvens TaxID=1297424 RepID=A0A369ALT2_9FIRM|nr:dihydroorotate dehydrogenase electron transfer subunit [Anaerobacterium chartisolvens]RCX10349.1 dihydroorotate oxidase B electron transfer subunit [Anaerobacterium chartisolvens]